MSISNTRVKSFVESERGKLMRLELSKMVENMKYNTRSIYSTHDVDGLSFVDKHMRYASQYPNLDCNQYILNLKLMTKQK